MAIDATTDRIEENYNIDQRRHFYLYYAAPAFNSDVVSFRVPTSIANENNTSVMVVTDMAMTYVNTASTANIQIEPTIDVGALGTWWVPLGDRFTVAAVFNQFVWQNIGFRITPGWTKPNENLFIISQENGAALDSMYLIVRGYFEKPPDFAQVVPVQAVSLEGYKWPLSRRR